MTQSTKQIISFLILILVTLNSSCNSVISIQLEISDSKNNNNNNNYVDQSIKDEYVELNRILEDRLNSDDMESNFILAKEISMQSYNLLDKFDRALSLFIKLGHLKEFSRCNEEDLATLIDNNQAISRLKKNDRISRFYYQLSIRHAERCQEDYELRFDLRLNQWFSLEGSSNSKNLDRISHIMDKIIFSIQQNKQPKLRKRTNKIRKKAYGVHDAKGSSTDEAADEPNGHDLGALFDDGDDNHADADDDKQTTKRRRIEASPEGKARYKRGAFETIKRVLGSGLLFAKANQEMKEKKRLQKRQELISQQKLRQRQLDEQKLKLAKEIRFEMRRHKQHKLVQKELIKKLQDRLERLPPTSGSVPAPPPAPPKDLFTSANVRHLSGKTIAGGDKLDIANVKRMIAVGKYKVDRVKSSKIIWSGLAEVAANDPKYVALIKAMDDKNDIDDDKLDELIRSYVTRPCKKYVVHFGSVYEPARNDIKYVAKERSTNENFYRGFAYYELCKSVIEQEDDLLKSIARAGEDYILRQVAKSLAADS